MRKKWSVVLLLICAFMLAIGGSVSAVGFDDLKDEAGKDKIEALKEKGLLQGISDRKFGPKKQLTNAEGIALIVKGLGLNIDNIRFIKAPLASDYYTKVPDKAWYAGAFVIAQYKGLEVPQDIDPGKMMTREQFANYLYKALITKIDLVTTEQFIVLKDDKDVDSNYMNAIQKLLIIQVASLDKNEKFYPKKVITRYEAAVMLANTIEYLDNQQVSEPTSDIVTLNVNKVDSEVNKITISRGKKPTGGYSIAIDRIDFSGDQAIIYYSTQNPAPGTIVTQAITEPKAVTFISTKYKPVLQKIENVPLQPTGTTN